MQMRQFGKTGLQVSALGFGSAPVGFLATEVEHVGAILSTLLDSGVNLIDTAAVYPGSEEAIGKTVSGRRKEFILVSKCGSPGSGPEDPSWAPEALELSIDRSLSRLNTDHLDVILLHSCSLETLQAGDALGALQKAREAGKVRFVGYSGDNEPAALAATLDEVAVIETSVNLCDQANIDRVLPAAQQNHLGVIAKRPIANAAWKDLGSQRGMYREYARVYSERLEKMGLAPRDLGFDGDPDDAWPRIAFRFTLSQPGVHTAVVGTTDPSHAAGNIRAIEEGPLPDEAVKKLRDAFHRAEAASAEPWLGQT